MMSSATSEAPTNELAGDCRPRVRRDVLYVQTPDGVLFHSADGGFEMRGAAAYAVTAAVLPHLTGDTALDELCSGLSTTHRSLVIGLVSALVQRGLARALPAGMLWTCEPAVADHFAAQIGYVEHYVDDPGRRFQRFRDSTVAVLGGGALAHWCVLGLLRNGCTSVLAQGGCGAENQASVDAELEVLRTAGVPAQLRLLEPDTSTRPASTEPAAMAEAALAAGALAEAAVVVIAEDHLSPRLTAPVLERVSPDAHILSAWRFGDVAVVGGSAPRRENGPCWTCAALRLSANGPARDSARLWQSIHLPALPPAGQPVSRSLQAMLGNLLAFEVFRLRAGVLPAETNGRLVLQDLVSADVTSAPLLVHPDCPGHGSSSTTRADLLGALRALADVRPAPQDPHRTDSLAGGEAALARLSTLSPIVHTRTGVLNCFDDETLIQTPLKVSTVLVGLGSGESVRVPAGDLHTVASARLRAAHRGVGAYVDGLATAPARARLAIDAVSGEQVEIADYDDLLVQADPAAALGFVGVADRIETAVLHGTLDALARRALDQAMSSQRPVWELSRQSSWSDDREQAFLDRAAQHLAVRTTLYRLDAAGGAHVVLAVATGLSERPLWQLAGRLTERAARIAATRDVLARVQLAGEIGVDSADGRVNPLGDFDPSTLAVRGFEDPLCPRPPATWPLMLKRLDLDGVCVRVSSADTPDLMAVGLRCARVRLMSRDA